jgi:hypothetical protein
MGEFSIILSAFTGQHDQSIWLSTGHRGYCRHLTAQPILDHVHKEINQDKTSAIVTLSNST